MTKNMQFDGNLDKNAMEMAIFVIVTLSTRINHIQLETTELNKNKSLFTIFNDFYFPFVKIELHYHK
jgi:hypothetical protein